MIVAINFADQKFELCRKYNTETAYSKGKADKVIEYCPNDIDVKFNNENRKILSYKRGFGLWLWKPYFIYKTLQEMNEGDYLFYSDSGSYYIDKIQNLISRLEKTSQSVMGFGLPLYERQFTKKETFELMDYYNYEQNQVLATYILLKKTAYSINFVKEWLDYASDERIISPQYFYDNIKEFDDFIEHREDQSVFSILYHKKGLKVFRDPSQYGDRPWQYSWLKIYSTRNDNFSQKWNYNPIKFKNSSYPQIIVGYRDPNIDIEAFKKKEKRITILTKIGLHKFYFKIRFGAYFKK